ncbi:hypothetical protein ACPWT1_17885 [Ramlibacter sp. MMS24-I3-19]|uniref:hypothetical protein n=1 Tax=Ramlibacter sp. MMS24-I3-19 TaxID=3416606 RepID=UPI003D07CD9B
MVTTRKPAVSSSASPAKPVVAVKPSVKLAATPAGRKNASKAKPAKDKSAKTGKSKPAAKAGNGNPAKQVKAGARTLKAGKSAKAGKAAKTKLVRDSFSFPKAEYAVLDVLKDRAVKAGKAVKKSELLRAGLKALAALPDLAFHAALDVLPARKPARKSKKG